MNTVSNKTRIAKDLKEKSITVSREFNASNEKVWKAWTDRTILDKWWGPEPWHAKTKSQDFRAGGSWLYAMVGPEKQQQWSRMNYVAINPQKSIEIEDAFTDENGKVNKEFPVSQGRISFTPTGTGTKVEWKLQYKTDADVKKIVDTGFEDGIAICFDQLEDYLDNNG